MAHLAFSPRHAPVPVTARLGRSSAGEAYASAFGDGATGPVATHTYSTAGSFTVTLTVSDLYGATAMTSDTVAVP